MDVYTNQQRRHTGCPGLCRLRGSGRFQRSAGIFHFRPAGFRGKGIPERVRTALRNSGFRFQAKKITVNLSPAGIHKGGTAYDLPIAIAVLGAFEQADTRELKDSLVIGELGLDGCVKPISGVLPLVDAARNMG